jgi:hypothetical protein
MLQASAGAEAELDAPRKSYSSEVRSKPLADTASYEEVAAERVGKPNTVTVITRTPLTSSWVLIRNEIEASLP